LSSDDAEILIVILVRNAHPIFYLYLYFYPKYFRRTKMLIWRSKISVFYYDISFIFAGHANICADRGETRTDDVIKGEPCNESNRSLCRIRTKIIPLTGNSVRALRNLVSFHTYW